MKPLTYESGSCKVISRDATHHELWHTHGLVAVFKTFRAAVRYLYDEFGALA